MSSCHVRVCDRFVTTLTNYVILSRCFKVCLHYGWSRAGWQTSTAGASENTEVRGELTLSNFVISTKIIPESSAPPRRPQKNVSGAPRHYLESSWRRKPSWLTSRWGTVWVWVRPPRNISNQSRESTTFVLLLDTLTLRGFWNIKIFEIQNSFSSVRNELRKINNKNMRPW